MLTVSQHISQANIVSSEVKYEWDEWNVEEYYRLVDTTVYDRLSQLTTRASTGFAIACGEWVCHRFSGVSSDADPLLFLEAAWAGNIHPAYCIYTENDDDDWRGPIRGPLNMTMTIVNDALFCLDDEPEAAVRAGWMYSLTLHVLPEVDAFKKWVDTTINRLQQQYLKSQHPDRAGLFDDEIDRGPRVPREAFDPNFPLDPRQTASLLDRFLGGLHPDQNPYLQYPDELDEVDGLPGTPYRFVEPNEDEE